MELMFIGAAHEVTGSCTLLSACGHNILIDCGMEQGADIYENCTLPVVPSEIDCILLTHAHIDHSGKIPLLAAQGFKGIVYTTEATKDLCSIMLEDSAHIQEFEAKWKNRKSKRAGKEPYIPLYTTDDAVYAMTKFSSCQYNKNYPIFDGISIRFIDAGHLLGSASIEITVVENGKSQTILFSGDIGNANQMLIKEPDQPKFADYVIIESTYGDRLHEGHPDYIKQLTSILQSTFDKGGNVVIPSFAVGRTQTLLYMLRQIKGNNLIKNHDHFPVYLDSPLAVKATNIYSGDMHEYYDKETLNLIEQGINPISFDDLKLSLTNNDSKLINEDNLPKVIISASGMCEAGRIRHHLKHNLWRPECTILFVGYQTSGTLGRLIIEGVESVKLFNEEVKILAKVDCKIEVNLSLIHI